MSVHISEKEFREEIFSLTAVFQNVEEFQKVEKYIKQLLIEIMKNAVVNQEKKTVTYTQHKIVAILASLTKHCNLMEVDSRGRQ